MLKFICLLALLVLYTYILKRKFDVGFFDEWTSERLGSELLVYVMIALPIALSGATVVIVDVILEWLLIK
jgi:hypothetical protein|tara:strand:- start:40 stop:249 length:210 start_codon:yes stop_codon:yes gene_type:complete